VRGRTFPIGDRIRVLRYRYGGGRSGNVPAGAISTIETLSGLRVANPLPTTGGEDAESLERAIQRIPGELGRRDRAVTAGDFEELARIPGVGRAECLPLFDPRTKSTDPATGRFNAAGVVSVMVWPGEDPRHPEAPMPDTALLHAVCAKLDARRLVTTELYVVPPTYHPVAVSVGLRVKAGASAAGVRRWVEFVLRQYLAPLPPYGPDGGGWPLGHRVYGPELEAAVLQVDGVDFLEGLEVADMAGGTAKSGPVELAGWEVPELIELTVVVGPPPAPGSGGVQPPPGPVPVPVPVPKAVC
jgi:predicted phage baseplate assembly protein